MKRGYKFKINDRSAFYDWFYAFFELRFKLQLRANAGSSAEAEGTVINGAHSFIKHLVINSAGKIIYDTDHSFS